MTTPDANPTNSPVRLKTSLDHLPESKRNQLKRITQCICQTVPLDRLILFGSYARGDWVEDPGHLYFSDYDLLVIVAEPFLVHKTGLWARLENELDGIRGRIPVSLLVHSLKEVNREIRYGQYFFADIVKEGIALYDAGHTFLATPKAMNPDERLAQGLRNFDYWFNSACRFWRGCGYYMARGELAEAAFLLHQSVERYFHALTLVYTGYKHKIHDIRQLAEIGADLPPELIDAMPRTEPTDKVLFELLRRAYIEARYSKSYRITIEELETLREQVRDLAQRTLTAAQEKLESHRGPESVGPLPTPPDYTENIELPPAPSLDDPDAVERWSQAVLDEGREIGRVEGREEGAMRIARNLLAEGMDEERVVRITGLSPREVQSLTLSRP